MPRKRRLTASRRAHRLSRPPDLTTPILPSAWWIEQTLSRIGCQDVAILHRTEPRFDRITVRATFPIHGSHSPLLYPAGQAPDRSMRFCLSSLAAQQPGHGCGILDAAVTTRQDPIPFKANGTSDAARYPTRYLQTWCAS
jgi:hypothetical protein